MRTLAILPALVAGCGGLTPVSLTDFESATRDAFCRHYEACSMVESLDTCHELGPGVVIRVAASQRAAVDMGRSKYSGDHTASCLEAFAERSCDVTSQSGRTIPDACFTEFTGTGAAGSACAFDGECASLDCNAPASCQMACCTGTCVGDAPPGHARLGESCEHARCDPGSFCDAAMLTCVALAPAGAFCGSPAECRYGLDCDPGGTCVALPGPGQPCTGACRDEGTTCSATTGTCVKVGLAGAPCASSEDCSPVYRCDATRHCSAGLPLGSPCTAGVACAGDRAFCDVPDGAVTGSCVLPKANGQPCQRDAHCESVHCDPIALQCTAEPVCL